MNRYEEFLDELDIPENNPYLGSNIKQLRLEQRLSINEFSKKVNIDEKIIEDIEKKIYIPSFQEVEQMLPVLRISHYDIMTRNIVLERMEAEKKIKHSKERKNYDWYYGSTRKIVLDLIFIISVPLLFLFGLFIIYPVIKNVYIESTIYLAIGENIKYLIAYIFSSIITGIIITIKTLKKINYHFVWWHIFYMSVIITLVEAIGILLTIPYYIYTIVILIIKKGRNHK